MEIDPHDGAVVKPESEPMVTKLPEWSEESEPESEPLPSSSYSEASDPTLLGASPGCREGF